MFQMEKGVMMMMFLLQKKMAKNVTQKGILNIMTRFLYLDHLVFKLKN